MEKIGRTTKLPNVVVVVLNAKKLVKINDGNKPVAIFFLRLLSRFCKTDLLNVQVSMYYYFCVCRQRCIYFFSFKLLSNNHIRSADGLKNYNHHLLFSYSADGLQ